MITLVLTQEEADCLRQLLARAVATAPPEGADGASRIRDYLPAGPPAIRTPFEALHRRIDGFATPPEGQEEFAAWLQPQGLDERTAHQIATGTLRGGESFGHAHPIDAANLVEKAFYAQNVREISLRIVAEGDTDTYDGHLTLEIQEVRRWTDP